MRAEGLEHGACIKGERIGKVKPEYICRFDMAFQRQQTWKCQILEIEKVRFGNRLKQQQLQFPRFLDQSDRLLIGPDYYGIFFELSSRF